MTYSMTGYGKGIVQTDVHTVTTEIKTVNHRFLDIHILSSHSIHAIEEEIKSIIQKHFNRGRINVHIHIEGESDSPNQVEVDWKLMDQYMERFREVQDRYNLSGNIPIEIVNQIPDLFSLEQRDNFMQNTKEIILSSVDKACVETSKSRLREGEYLQKDLLSRLQRIKHIISTLENEQPAIMKDYYERIRERMLQYTKGISEIDTNRLHQEIAMLIEKGDITEEITRLNSHLAHSKQLFDEQDPIGRKLDFIVQEIHRELNTIGSKAIDEKMGRLIVQSKGELEKVREQIQNIE